MSIFDKISFYLTVSRRARKNERNFRRWLAANVPSGLRPVDITRVYTDKHGNNFYVHNDPLSVSLERVQIIEEKLKATTYNFSKEALITRFEEIEKAVEASDADRVMQLCADAKFRISELAEEKTLLDLACVFFLIDGENPYTANPLTFQRKRELAANDDDLRAFFLQTAWDTFKASANSANFGILKYLATAKGV